MATIRTSNGIPTVRMQTALADNTGREHENKSSS